jgi:hypothetical protein
MTGHVAMLGPWEGINPIAVAIQMLAGKGMQIKTQYMVVGIDPNTPHVLQLPRKEIPHFVVSHDIFYFSQSIHAIRVAVL